MPIGRWEHNYFSPPSRNAALGRKGQERFARMAYDHTAVQHPLQRPLVLFGDEYICKLVVRDGCYSETVATTVSDCQTLSIVGQGKRLGKTPRESQWSTRRETGYGEVEVYG